MWYLKAGSFRSTIRDPVSIVLEPWILSAEARQDRTARTPNSVLWEQLYMYLSICCQAGDGMTPFSVAKILQRSSSYSTNTCSSSSLQVGRATCVNSTRAEADAMPLGRSQRNLQFVVFRDRIFCDAFAAAVKSGSSARLTFGGCETLLVHMYVFPSQEFHERQRRISPSLCPLSVHVDEHENRSNQMLAWSPRMRSYGDISSMRGGLVAEHHELAEKQPRIQHVIPASHRK